MAYSRPTLDQLLARAFADMEAELGNGAAYIKATFERAMAKVQGGLAHTQHGHLAYIARQAVPYTAEDEYLIGWAEFFMGSDARNGASAATFPITVTGTVDGTAIPLGTVWTRADGVEFQSTAAEVLAGLEATVDVEAVNPGASGNTNANATLTLTSPIIGIDSAATVIGGDNQTVGGGSDIETIPSLKQRLLDYLNNPPKGGATGDYVTWAKSVDGVSRAWEIPLALGPGSVVVLFVQDVFDSDGFYVDTVFPSAPAIAAVQAYMDTVIPITVNPSMTSPTGHFDYVFAPTEVEINPVIALSPNNSDTQIEVTRYLQDLVLRTSAPRGTILLSQINEAISLAPGEDDHNLVSPVTDLTAIGTQLYTLGTPTFQDL